MAAKQSTQMNPLAFDYSPYASVTDVSHEWATDMRHIQLLHAIGVLMQPLSTLLEIGSFKGASTAAFVALLRGNHAHSLVCVEPHPQPGLKTVLSGVERASIVPRLSDSLPDPCFVFIDGDHGKPALKDIEWSLARSPAVICMHDTNSVNVGYPGCWGARDAANILKAHPGYWWLEDKKPRDGERTGRGFMSAFHQNTFTTHRYETLKALFATDEKWWL
jgi:hypothetical protein